MNIHQADALTSWWSDGEKEIKNTGTAIKYFTERDLNILHDLYRFRTLTTDQVTKVHFDNRPKRDYVYRRMHLLRKDGLIESRPIVEERGRKKTSCYMITDRGISLLAEEGVIQGTKQRAKDNRVEGSQLKYVVDMNEIFLLLRSQGWTALDSREVKRKYSMNRANVIQGSIMNRDGNEYGVYLLHNQTTEETISKIIHELRNEILNRVIIFCKGKESYDQIRTKILADRTIPGEEIGLLPYEFGIRVLQRLSHLQNFIQLYNQFGEVHEFESKRPFSKYLIKHQGEEKYLASYLLGDQRMLQWLNRYGQDQYMLEKRKVLLFAWRGQVSELQHYFQAYSHIEIITPNLE